MKKLYTFIPLVWLAVLVSACLSTPSQETDYSGQTPAGSEDQVADWYTVYFTDPDSPTAGTYRGGPDSDLAKAIREARLSVDAAIYHLNLWSIRDALIAAHEAGVAVRVVVESDNMDEVEIQQVQDAGIEVLGDRRESLMHNKFVIIDGAEVWTGSMNFTVNGAYRNNNSLVRLRSVRIAENYTSEFDEMFERDMFGDNVSANTPHPSLSINDTLVETYFSPDDAAASQIVEHIQGAQSSILFLAYSFTSDEIAAAMLEKAEMGITVAGVFEEGQYYANIGTEYDRLVERGLAVRLDGNDRNMHHKVIIIDEEVVIFGSYNFSRNADEYNDENILIITNREIAAVYLAEFDRIFSN